MPAKKILILFLLTSLAGHILMLSLTGFIDMRGGNKRWDILTVDLKESWKRPDKNREEKEKVKPIRPPIERKGNEYLEETVALTSNDDRYLLARSNRQPLTTPFPRTLTSQG